MLELVQFSRGAGANQLCFERRRGEVVVIDFDDLPDGGVVRSVATRLAPGWSDDDVDQWARFANDATSPNRPQAAGTGFLGGSAESGGPDGPDGAWAGLGSVMVAADDAYARLRADAG